MRSNATVKSKDKNLLNLNMDQSSTPVNIKRVS
jgi:hypothetical protein